MRAVKAFFSSPPKVSYTHICIWMIENLWMNIITYHKFDFTYIEERKHKRILFVFPMLHSLKKVIYMFDKFNFIVGKAFVEDLLRISRLVDESAKVASKKDLLDGTTY